MSRAEDDGATPVLVAARSGQIAMVHVLVEAGADMNRAQDEGATPLQAATLNGNTEVVCLLVEAARGRTLP